MGVLLELLSALADLVWLCGSLKRILWTLAVLAAILILVGLYART